MASHFIGFHGIDFKSNIIDNVLPSIIPKWHTGSCQEQHYQALILLNNIMFWTLSSQADVCLGND